MQRHEEYTKTKRIGPVVEEQEEQQFFDGTDGPSNFTDPAIYPATDLDSSCSMQRCNVWAPSDQV